MSVSGRLAMRMRSSVAAKVSASQATSCTRMITMPTSIGQLSIRAAQPSSSRPITTFGLPPSSSPPDVPTVPNEIPSGPSSANVTSISVAAVTASATASEALAESAAAALEVRSRACSDFSTKARAPSLSRYAARAASAFSVTSCPASSVSLESDAPMPLRLRRHGETLGCSAGAGVAGESSGGGGDSIATEPRGSVEPSLRRAQPRDYQYERRAARVRD